jgi:molecular chaperone GrpE
MTHRDAEAPTPPEDHAQSSGEAPAEDSATQLSQALAQAEASAARAALLEVQLSRAQSELANRQERLDEVLRAYRHMDEEYRRSRERLERELRRDLEAEKNKTIAAFFEVADNLERSVEAARQRPNFDALLGGIELVSQQFRGILERQGVEPIPAEGQPFDPDHHEAVGVVPVESASQHQTVVRVFRSGYRVGATVLRPAMVQVGHHASSSA